MNAQSVTVFVSLPLQPHSSALLATASRGRRRGTGQGEESMSKLLSPGQSVTQRAQWADERCNADVFGNAARILIVAGLY